MRDRHEWACLATMPHCALCASVVNTPSLVMHSLRLLLAMTLAVPALAASTPYSVAALVHEEDATKVANSLRAEIASPKPLIRATAARVVTVRGVTDLLPLLREAVKTEED